MRCRDEVSGVFGRDSEKQRVEPSSSASSSACTPRSGDCTPTGSTPPSTSSTPGSMPARCATPSPPIPARCPIRRSISSDRRRCSSRVRGRVRLSACVGHADLAHPASSPGHRARGPSGQEGWDGTIGHVDTCTPPCSRRRWAKACRRPSPQEARARTTAGRAIDGGGGVRG